MEIFVAFGRDVSRHIGTPHQFIGIAPVIRPDRYVVQSMTAGRGWGGNPRSGVDRLKAENRRR